MTTHADNRFITAGQDRRVRHPGGRLLDEAGETVAWNSYWERLAQDGDVVVGKAPKAQDEKKA